MAPPGSSVSAEEFARALIVEIHELERWNLWLRQDRTGEHEAAFEQWTRAEPGFWPKTPRQQKVLQERRRAVLDASTTREKARTDAEHSARAAACDAARARHGGPAGAAGAVGGALERAELAGGARAPAMPAQARQERLAELDKQVTEARTAIKELAGQAGDPETVSDENG